MLTPAILIQFLSTVFDEDVQSCTHSIEETEKTVVSKSVPSVCSVYRKFEPVHMGKDY